jgi:hypothetical protein
LTTSELVIAADILGAIEHCVPNAFSNLRYLECAIHAASARSIAAIGWNLSELRVIVLGTTDVLEEISRLKQLRTLSIDFVKEEAAVSPASVLCLRKLTDLRELKVSAMREWPDFTDGDMVSLVSRLPQLQLFEWEVVSAVSDTAFILVGRHCRQLERLTLDSCNLRALADEEQVVFPRLSDIWYWKDGIGKAVGRYFPIDAAS